MMREGFWIQSTKSCAAYSVTDRSAIKIERKYSILPKAVSDQRAVNTKYRLYLPNETETPMIE